MLIHSLENKLLESFHSRLQFPVFSKLDVDIELEFPEFQMNIPVAWNYISVTFILVVQ